MNQNRLIFGVILLALLGFVLVSSAFIVKQQERAILLEFGALKEDNIQPGLHFRVPFVTKLFKFDVRVRTLDQQSERVLVSGDSRLTEQLKELDSDEPQEANLSETGSSYLSVDYFVKWRVDDVGLYYKRTQGRELNANKRLVEMVKDVLKSQLSGLTLQDAVSGQRTQIMVTMRDSLAIKAKDFGIQIVDVRIKHIDLPREVNERVYRSMKAKFEETAKALRAGGNKKAEEIRSEADRQVGVIKAEADGNAARIVGEGEALTIKIYADAYSKDPEFYRFYRSLQAYRKSMSGNGDVLVIEPDSEFFQYFKQAKAE